MPPAPTDQPPDDASHSSIGGAAAGARLPWRAGLIAALGLAALYAAMTQRTWSIDGAIMTLKTDHVMDLRSYGHFLLRPMAFGCASLVRATGGHDPAVIYHALRVLLTALGILGTVAVFLTTTTRQFNFGRSGARRGGLAGAALALVVVGASRDLMRHLTTLDEKGLGLCGLGLALAATAALFARPGGGPNWKPWRLLGAAALWSLAVFTHLQNAPYAMAFAAVLPWALPREWPARRRWAWSATACAAAAGAGLALFALIHAGLGGWHALPDFLGKLFGGSPAPPPVSLKALVSGTIQGYIKAYFIIDRFSPKPFLLAAAAGFGLIALALAYALAPTFRLMRRGVDPVLAARRDPLAPMLALGMALHALIMPLTHNYPDYGDSYTALVLASLVLLAAAPRPLLAAAAALMLVVNLPAQVRVSFPPITMANHLTRMAVVNQARDGTPWVIVDSLARPPGEQEFAPYFYPMNPELRFARAEWDTLPAGGCLIEVPLVIAADGRPDFRRADAIAAALRRAGRDAARAMLYDRVLIVSADFRAYGIYFHVLPKAATLTTAP